ncbi:MAG: M48 family metallopeptidase [Thermodesulfobacteriota bacterium]|nr:M48 family metallopeptidase [Thermodesulfobacteriota bacterium]
MLCANIYLTVVLGSILLAYVVNLAVSYLNMRGLDPELPLEFQGVFDAEKYKKSQEYARANARLEAVEETWSTGLLIGFILLGGFNILDGIVRSWDMSSIATGLLFFAILFFLNDIFSLPFSLYRNFVIEERFEFNTMTFGVYMADKVKTYFLAVLLGGPLLGALLFFFEAAGPFAWLWAWLATVLTAVTIQYLAPTLILPLFNKFTPLEQGTLRTAIEDFAARAGFGLKGVFVMDGSKRSTKSNAFFTGFGKKKRIALFDTLISRHEPDEIIAILAHEIGHYKKRHVLKNMLLLILKTGILFYLMSFFLTSQGLFNAFGMEQISVHAGFVFFLFLYTPVSLVLSVAFNALSRKYEYQADGFAVAATGKKEPMISALKKLSADNLSNLTPHPAYVFLHYSHPPVLARIKAIREPVSSSVSSG